VALSLINASFDCVAIASSPILVSHQVFLSDLAETLNSMMVRNSRP
jgi:hypothetical protein